MAPEAGIPQTNVQHLRAAQRDQAASVVRLSKDTQFEAKFLSRRAGESLGPVLR